MRMMMTFDDDVYKSANYSKKYCKANELLISSNAIDTFPFKVSALIKEQSDCFAFLLSFL